MNSQDVTARFVTIETKPEPIEINLALTALIIVDWQNVFAGRTESNTFFKDHMEAALSAIYETKKVADAARAAGIPVIYLKMMKDPERKGGGIIKTPHDVMIVEELTPSAGDMIIEKVWYSGFRDTNLDEFLKKGGITHLIFTGTATNICVESTLRDAYFLNYVPILVSDATANAGPPATQQATLWNVETAFGWVTTAEDIVKGLSGK
jgi:ureidoacrylate peracid hydrolase